MKVIALILTVMSFNLFARPLACEGSSYFGLKGYVVIFSSLQEGDVQLQVVHGENDLIFEPVNMKLDYQDGNLINFHGLGAREIELSGYLNRATMKGLILFGNQEIKLKNCQ